MNLRFRQTANNNDHHSSQNLYNKNQGAHLMSWRNWLLLCKTYFKSHLGMKVTSYFHKVINSNMLEAYTYKMLIIQISLYSKKIFTEIFDELKQKELQKRNLS